VVLLISKIFQAIIAGGGALPVLKKFAALLRDVATEQERRTGNRSPFHFSRRGADT
jgi:hypothetical protein